MEKIYEEIVEWNNKKDAEFVDKLRMDFGEKPDEFTIQQVTVPAMSNFDIEASINNIMSNEDYIKHINDLIIEDEKERYVRELLNRLNTIIRYMKRASDDDTYQELIIAIAKGDLNTIYDYEKYLDEETFEIVKGYESKGDKNDRES